LKGLLHDVACAAAFDDGRIVLDIFCNAGGAAGPFAAQALYHRDSPFTQLSLNRGGPLSWGGLLHDGGTWLFAQGWDAPAGVRELYFYRAGAR
jgi:beta-1,2-mannosidase